MSPKPEYKQVEILICQIIQMRQNSYPIRWLVYARSGIAQENNLVVGKAIVIFQRLLDCFRILPGIF